MTAAVQTRVEYAAGRGRESIDVEIELPAGSRLEGEAGAAALRCTGRVDEVRFKTGVGEIHLDRTGPLKSAPAPATSASTRPTGAPS